jgi:hypothetical protein
MARSIRGKPKTAVGPARLTPSDLFVQRAVEVLDEMVGSMVRKRAAKMPRDFLDWVADELTPRLEVMALAYFSDLGPVCMPATVHIRSWVTGVCERWLDEKLAGMDPFAGRRAPCPGADDAPGLTCETPAS